MPQDTTLVIVSYNSAHLLEERLRAYAGYPVVVVDNASSDGTVDWIADAFPAVRLVANRVNSGYGRAANAGFEQVETRFGLLVNPDAQLGAREIEALEREARAIEGEWLFVAPNTGLAPTGARPAMSSLERIEAASGAALLFEMTSLRRLGGFDPNIFLFYEETDLCRRARTAGLGLFHAPAIRVEHELGTSTQRSLAIEYVRKWHYNWSRLYYCRKHGLWSEFANTLFRNLVLARLKLGRLPRDEVRYALCHARHHSARAFLAGRPAFLESGDPYREPILTELERRPLRD